MTTGIVDLPTYNDVPILRNWLSVVTMRMKEIIATMDTRICTMEIPVENIISVVETFKAKYEITL